MSKRKPGIIVWKLDVLQMRNIYKPEDNYQGEQQFKQETPYWTQKQPAIEISHNSNILLDTAASTNLVRRGLIPDTKSLEVSIHCAYGDVTTYPIAEVEVEVRGLYD